MLTSEKVTDEIFTTVCILVIVVGSEITVLVYFVLYIDDLRSIKKQLALEDRNSAILDAIPCIFRFAKRVDNFTVLDNGDGRLEWIFEIYKETDETVHFVEFPILCEKIRGDLAETSSIVIEKVVVDKINRIRESEYLPLRIAYEYGIDSDERRLEELGSIRVPVDLHEGKDKTNVMVTLLLKDVFNECDEQEFVIVDIPYVTEFFQLHLTSEHKSIFVPSDFLQAYANNNSMNNDNDEVAEQKQKTNSHDGEFIWTTTYPKLGYRYKFKFKVIEPSII